MHSRHDYPASLASSDEQEYSQEAEEFQEECIENSVYSESEWGHTGGPAATSAYPRREYTFVSDGKEPSGLKFTHKVGPEYTGAETFFRYEKAVKEWLIITTFPEAKPGPHLFMTLKGPAHKWAEHMNITKIPL